MRKIVEVRYQEASGLWRAEVNGAVLEARTPRALRGDVRRVLGDRVVAQMRVVFADEREREIEAVVRATRAYKTRRHRVDVALDRLNMERRVLAEKMLGSRCSTELVAARLEMPTSSLAQLMDVRQYAGRRVNALLAGDIEPGSRAMRGPRGEDDERGELDEEAAE